MHQSEFRSQLHDLLSDLPEKRVLITGGQGMLGHAFEQQIQRHLPNFEVRAPGKNELDVSDASQVSSWTEWVRDGWVIHCGALVNVERCEVEREQAKQVILGGSINVSKMAREAGAKLLYPQSFLIYSGRSNPIKEDEEPQPLAFYGELKKEAEAQILEICADALSVRMAGFFGGGARDKNFVGRIIPAMKKRIDAGLSEMEVGDRVWQPTWTEDLALNSLYLLARNSSGVYQMACHGSASFYDVAVTILESFGWSDRLRLRKVSSAVMRARESGARPDVAILSCHRLREENADFQRPWQGSLREYLSQPYFNRYRGDVEELHAQSV